MVVAAYLHDTIEDTHTTYEELISEFGVHVANLVLGLTSRSKQISIAGPRTFRKLADLEYLGKQSKEVHIIKLEDRWDNLKDMSLADPGFISLYCRETRDLLKVVGAANPERATQIGNLIVNMKIDAEMRVLEKSVKCVASR
jgi:(p)ppGpp synthase/HD superfamily hydrolase